MRVRSWKWLLLLGIMLGSVPVSAQTPDSPEAPTAAGDGAPGVMEITFTPAPGTQVAIWIEGASGELVATLRLTEAVAYRGVGNRPGASEMNSGFRWPYGRREGVLPVWAHRRASAPGAALFRSVIFQDRTSEGFASRTTDDSSPDDYYCLSQLMPERSRRDALDAVSCASVFSSDKGRFLTEQDVAMGYAEPYEAPLTRVPSMRPLPLLSLYPPRRDVGDCKAPCIDHADVSRFAAHALEVMPELDAITMATPMGDVSHQDLIAIPPAWGPGAYRVCVEANVEGDYNRVFSAENFPTPVEPADLWDFWSKRYGYPYRGQPSVVYCVDVELGGAEQRRFTTGDAAGSAGGWAVEDGNYGQMASMDGMSDDAVGAPRSGADRLQLGEDGERLVVTVTPAAACQQNTPPSAVSELSLHRHPEELHAHAFARMRFRAAGDDRAVYRYDVRVSTSPITDDPTFTAATPAKEASIEAAELRVPVGPAQGEPIQVDLGGLAERTHYFMAIRAMDGCAATGPIRSAEITTPARTFATVSPCFVATAAYGSPLATEIGCLRRFRDRVLAPTGIGRALVDAYYALGPTLASSVREHASVRLVVRAALAPIVTVARWLST